MNMNRAYFLLLALTCLAVLTPTDTVFAQEVTAASSTLEAADFVSESASSAASIIQEKSAQTNTKDTTQPEELPEKVAVLSLFESRPVDSLGPLSFMAFWVQKAVQMGIPANTIFLILLTPILALIVSLTRVVLGLPTLDMLVPIALAFVFVTLGIVGGALILTAIVLASYVAKTSLANLKIMFYPKRSLSILFLAMFVFAALTAATMLDLELALTVSIFPILVLMLLGDSIVSVQLSKSFSETAVITSTTIAVGLLGFWMASNGLVRDTLILYPELVLLTIPVNLMIGRYFGLRATEYFRFNSLSD